MPIILGGKSDRFLARLQFFSSQPTVSDRLSIAEQVFQFCNKMPPKVKRATRREREAKSSNGLVNEIEKMLRSAGFNDIKITEYKCDSGRDDGSRQAPDEEERLFVDKDKKKWPKIVEREKEKFDNRNREECHAQLKFTTKLNRNMCTEMVKLAERHMLCIKKEGFYFTSSPGRYITAHWTRAEAFSRMTATLDTVPDVLFNLLRRKTKADGNFKNFVYAFAVVDDVQHNWLQDLAKNVSDLRKDYMEQFSVRSRAGEVEKILILSKDNRPVSPGHFSKWFAKVTPWLFDCQEASYMCKMGERAAQESVANRGKSTVPSADLWRKKMHDFKMALQPEIAQRVSEKLDQLLLVFAEGSAYKIKYGYPGRDGHPKFYLQLDALCSSKHSLLPDISLNDDGLCDQITAALPLTDNSCTLAEALKFLRSQVGSAKNIY